MKKLFLACLFLFFATITYSHDASSCLEGEIFIAKYQTCLGHEWIEGPYLNGRGQRAASTLRLTFDTHRELNLSNARVYPWMLMHGGHQHGSRPVSLEVVSESEIIVRNILLTQMNGQWLMRINLDAKEGDRPEVDFDTEFEIR